MEITLTAEKLAHCYEKRTVFRDISFSARKGDIIAVTGNNGSGKSTLLRILSGIMQPCSGSTVLSINSKSVIRQGTENVSIVSPDVKWYSSLTMNENILFYFSDPQKADRARTLAAEFNLHDSMNLLLSDFSSGMIQRFNIAAAMASSPPLIILDEPSAHLDENGKRMLHRIINEYSQNSIIILATHCSTEKSFASQRVHLE